MDTVEVLHNFLFFVGNNRDVLYTLLILIGEQLPEYEMFPLFLNFPAMIYLGMEYRDDKKIQMALALSLKKLFERFDNADEQQIQTDLISSPHWREWLRYIDNNRWRWQKCYDIVTQLMTTVSVFLAERELPKLCWTDGNMMILVDDGEAVDILRGE